MFGAPTGQARRLSHYAESGALVEVCQRRKRFALQPAPQKLHLRDAALAAEPRFGGKCNERCKQQHHAGKLNTARSRLHHPPRAE